MGDYMVPKVTLSSLLLSPWFVMIVSVSLSLGLYLFVYGFLFGNEYDRSGILLSTCIPAVISFPFSAISIRYHKRIAEQKVELERMNALNKRLFSTIAHDIRSPISSAYTAMRLLDSEDTPADERRDMIQKLTGSFHNLSQFLDELLEWSRLQLEEGEMPSKIIDIDQMLDRIVAIYEPMIATKALKVHRTVKAGRLKLEESGFSLILRNIIHNAIKFTPRDGVITIQIEERDDRVVTKVTDTGVGIDQEYLDKIVAGSESMSSRGTNNETGSGFGLQACIQYVRYSGGQVDIKSEKGTGTEFSVVLPVG